MKKNTPILYLALSVLLFASCTSGKKAGSVTNNASKRKPFCINVPIQSNAPLVGWYKSNVNRDVITAAFSLPSAYDVYEIDSAALSAFFMYANANDRQNLSFSVPLPGDLGCQPFVVAATGTMAKSLQQAYPDIASLKGNSPNDKEADIRLNYGNKKMDVSVTWNGSSYLAAPAQALGHTVYIVYDKTYSTEPEKPVKPKFRVQQNPMQSTIRSSDR